MTPPPELSRPVRMDEVGRDIARPISATADECAALARRFGLIAIGRLDADTMLHATAAGVEVRGTVRAAVTQPCAATGEPVAAVIDEPFALRFVHDWGTDEPDEEIEIGESDLDTLPIEGGTIDLGEAVAQTLALALPPYPRHPQADAILKARGVTGEGPSGPFAALAGLRKGV